MAAPPGRVKLDEAEAAGDDEGAAEEALDREADEEEEAGAAAVDELFCAVTPTAVKARRATRP